MGPNWLARIAAARHAPALGVGLLALAACGQAIGQAAALAAGQTQALVGGGAGEAALYAVPLCLLALAATVPLIFLRPAAAATAITVANVLAIAAFDGPTVGGVPAQMIFGGPTVAGMAAQVIAAYRLGVAGNAVRAAGFGHTDGSGRAYWLGRVPGAGWTRPACGAVDGAPNGAGMQWLAMGLAVPFLVLALTSHGSVGAVLLASLVPTAAGTGIALRAWREAHVQTTTDEVLADTLTEHMARGERARIARELHDVVAHHISMISVQAETARLTTPGLPAAGARRFAEIGDTARAGLTEMRRLLGVLREDADATVADRHPQPGLPQLTELIDTARETSGAGARLIVSGPVAEFDPGVELAAYRIVQEALTNARRHAPGAAVDVELRYGDDALRLRIRDNGPGPSVGAQASGGMEASRGTEPRGPGPSRGTEPHGHGLLGMRERALAVGGSLRTGPAPGGGFCVEAVLPAKPDATAAAPKALTREPEALAREAEVSR
jgi:signal transduction histidine kinase